MDIRSAIRNQIGHSVTADEIEKIIEAVRRFGYSDANILNGDIRPALLFDLLRVQREINPNQISVWAEGKQL